MEDDCRCEYKNEFDRADRQQELFDDYVQRTKEKQKKEKEEQVSAQRHLRIDR
jgi:hypothetical protein